MRIHHGLFLSLSAALAFALAGCATTAATGMMAEDAPRALPESGPVNVTWDDPMTFSEIRESNNRWASTDGNWLEELAKFMRTRAQPYLAPGERLDLTIIDVKRAGRFSPGRGPDLGEIRIVTERYPPRMTVHFRRYGANGAILAEGERKLTDQAFLLNASPINSTDPLRYEKRMVDTWLRRELGPAKR